jgi:hypothetical protein
VAARRVVAVIAELFGVRGSEVDGLLTVTPA